MRLLLDTHLLLWAAGPMAISPEVLALHVDCGQESDTLASQWFELVEEPARRAGLPGPRLVVLKSPYRFVIRPILDYALDLEKNNPERQIAVAFDQLASPQHPLGGQLEPRLRTHEGDLGHVADWAALLADADGQQLVPGFRVKTVDSTAAGEGENFRRA